MVLALGSIRSAMNRRVKILALLLGLVLVSGSCAGGQALVVPNSRYVLISREVAGGEPEFAAFKFLSQGDNVEDFLAYEWLSMHKGETTVGLEVQNYLAGTTTLPRRYGVGFDGYRFSWRPTVAGDAGVIAAIAAFGRDRETDITYCLSGRDSLWGIDLEREIIRLDREGHCAKDRLSNHP